MGKKALAIAISIILVLISAACMLESQGSTPNDSSVEPDDEVITEYFVGGDRLILSSIDELARWSTDVIRAEILDSRVERINTSLSSDPDFYNDPKHIRLHTVYRLVVLEVFAGNTKVGDIVEVMQMGGRLGNEELVYDRQLPLSSGDNLVLFLYNYEKEGFGHLPMTFMGGGQAVYRAASSNVNEYIEDIEGIEGTFRASLMLSDVILENFDPENHLSLTIGDLSRISSASEMTQVDRLEESSEPSEADDPATADIVDFEPSEALGIESDVDANNDDQSGVGAQGAQYDSGEADVN